MVEIETSKEKGKKERGKEKILAKERARVLMERRSVFGSIKANAVQEMQIRSYLQQMFQERSQCFELQREWA